MHQQRATLRLQQRAEPFSAPRRVLSDRSWSQFYLAQALLDLAETEPPSSRAARVDEAKTLLALSESGARELERRSPVIQTFRSSERSSPSSASASSVSRADPDPAFLSLSRVNTSRPVFLRSTQSSSVVGIPENWWPSTEHDSRMRANSSESMGIGRVRRRVWPEAAARLECRDADAVAPCAADHPARPSHWLSLAGARPVDSTPAGHRR